MELLHHAGHLHHNSPSNNFHLSRQLHAEAGVLAAPEGVPRPSALDRLKAQSGALIVRRRHAQTEAPKAHRWPKLTQQEPSAPTIAPAVALPQSEKLSRASDPDLAKIEACGLTKSSKRSLATSSISGLEPHTVLTLRPQSPDRTQPSSASTGPTDGSSATGLYPSGDKRHKGSPPWKRCPSCASKYGMHGGCPRTPSIGELHPTGSYPRTNRYKIPP